MMFYYNSWIENFQGQLTFLDKNLMCSCFVYQKFLVDCCGIRSGNLQFYLFSSAYPAKYSLVMSPATILERFDWSLDTLQAIQRFVAGVQPFQASKDGKT